ncbi:MAG: polysaccharide deacetylase, partial [Bradymonadaceae bacterium]
GLFDGGNIEDYRASLLGARAAVPALLDLFEEFGVCATWATVGFLMCESKEELLDTMPRKWPDYDDRRLSSYGRLHEIGDGEKQDPFHFAPSLVDEICRRPGQEIGTHTFSHYYCLDPGQSVEAFAADLEAAITLGRRRGLRIRSVVFPRNQFNEDYLKVCREQKILAVRGNPLTPWHHGASHQDYNSLYCRAGRLLDAYLPLNDARLLGPELRSDALPANIPATRFLRPVSTTLALLEPRRLQIINDELTSAARLGGLAHLWWHPHNFGLNTAKNLEFLREILIHFATLREKYGMGSHTMTGLARELRCDADHEVHRADRAG